MNGSKIWANAATCIQNSKDPQGTGKQLETQTSKLGQILSSATLAKCMHFCGHSILLVHFEEENSIFFGQWFLRLHPPFTTEL